MFVIDAVSVIVSFWPGVVVPIPTFVPVSNIMEFPTVFVPLNFETYPVVPETLDEFISFLAIIGH